MYTDKRVWTGTLADVLTSAADHTELIGFGSTRVKIHEVSALVTTLTSGASTVKFDKVTDTTRGDGSAGVITIPTATAVGQVVKDTTSTIFPFTLAAGEYIIPEVTSAAATAGGCIYQVKYEVIEDTAANSSRVTESA